LGLLRCGCGCVVWEEKKGNKRVGKCPYLFFQGAFPFSLSCARAQFRNPFLVHWFGVKTFPSLSQGKVLSLRFGPLLKAGFGKRPVYALSKDKAEIPLALGTSAMVGTWVIVARLPKFLFPSFNRIHRIRLFFLPGPFFLSLLAKAPCSLLYKCLLHSIYQSESFARAHRKDAYF